MVSVIIPNYCHAPYLVQRIESVLGQSYRDIEVILLDDASTDGSREILERYRSEPRVSHIVCNETNGGSPFGQWSRGFGLARGEYLWIAESDDFSDPRFLERCVAELEARPRCVVAHTLSRFVDGEGHPFGRPSPSEGRPPRELDGPAFVRRHLLWVNDLYNASMAVFRREALSSPPRVEAYLRYRYCGDWSFWMELVRKGSVCTVFEPLNCFRRHATTTTGRSERNGGKWLEVLSIVGWAGEHFVFPAAFRAAVAGKQLLHLARMGRRAGWPFGYRRAWVEWRRRYPHPRLLIVWYELVKPFVGLFCGR